jgi:REP-associated tyrosine transposase
MGEEYKIYPHNPPHYFCPNAIYMVTSGILNKSRLLREDSRKDFVCQVIFQRSFSLGWSLEAWAVLENHYHLIARAPENAGTLSRLIREIHSITAHWLNERDKTPGRRVWHNYWDTCITYETSYLARLKYVHLNPVKHGLVDNAEDYPYCSYQWFLECGKFDLVGKVSGQPIDRVQIFDDF